LGSYTFFSDELLPEEGLFIMSANINNNIQRLYLISAVVLLIGLAGSLAVYITADQDPESTPGYEVVGKNFYPNKDERSKKYIHDLELYGGKAAVLADDFNRCFDGLWHGNALAYTLACLTVIISGGIFLAARHSSDDAGSVTRDKDSEISK
jgi:hypothetical protein